MSKAVAGKALRSIPLANLDLIHGWLDEAPLHPLPYPSDDVCYGLARELQVAVNRANNTTMEKWAGHELPILELKDVSPGEVIAKRWSSLREAANNLMFHLERYADFVPRHEWGNHENRGLLDLEEALSLMSAHPKPLSVDISAPPGRPHELWHSTAHAISPAIQSALRSVGFAGRLRKTDAESATTAVGAAAISWAYGIEIQPAGFATAMRRRDRKATRPNSR